MHFSPPNLGERPLGTGQVSYAHHKELASQTSSRQAAPLQAAPRLRSASPEVGFASQTSSRQAAPPQTAPRLRSASPEIGLASQTSSRQGSAIVGSLLAFLLFALSPLPTLAQPPKAVPFRTIAILIGVGEYKHSSSRSRLDYAKRDAEELERILLTEGGLSPRQIRRLTDKEATRREIQTIIQTWLPQQLSSFPEAAVILYFSGHGELYKNQSYWLPYDVGPQPHDLPTTAISSEVFNSWLQGLPTKRILILTDACQPGGPAVKGVKSSLRPGTRRSFDSRSFGHGFVRISSAEQSDFSYESKRLQHGIFTKALIDGLRLFSRKRGIVTVAALWDYLSIRVEHLSLLHTKRRQRPVREGSETGAFPLLISDPRRSLPSIYLDISDPSSPLALTRSKGGHSPAFGEEEFLFDLLLVGGGGIGGGGFLQFSWHVSPQIGIFLAGGAIFGSLDIDTGWALRGLAQGFFAGGLQVTLGYPTRFFLRAAPAVAFGQGVSPALAAGTGFLWPLLGDRLLLGTSLDILWSPLASVGPLFYVAANLNLGFSF